jgi:hypothetical protein
MEAIMSSLPAAIGFVLFRQVIQKKIFAHYISNITREPIGRDEMDSTDYDFSKEETLLWRKLLNIPEGESWEVNAGTLDFRLNEDGTGLVIWYPDNPEQKVKTGEFRLPDQPVSPKKIMTLTETGGSGNTGFDDFVNCMDVQQRVNNETPFKAFIICLSGRL